MNLSELVREITGVNVETALTGVSIDSRTITAGQMFVALKGKRYDGHDFVKEALRKGAALVVVERDPGIDTRWVKVNDTLEFLWRLAALRREKTSWRVVGVTGSAGKTTTKDILAEVLSLNGKVSASVKSYNNVIGLSLSILNAPSDAEYLVLEIGTNAPGEIAFLTGVARPLIGVITHAGAAHLEGLKTVARVIHEKLDLFRRMDSETLKVANGDIRRLKKRAEEEGMDVLWFGLRKGNDIRIQRWRAETDGCEFECTFRDKTVRVKMVGFYHRAAAANTLPAVAVGLCEGLEVGDIASALSRIRPAAGRGVLKRIRHGFYIYDDTYNANPISFRAAIEAMRNIAGLFGLDTLIAIVGDMAEMGHRSYTEHLRLAQKFIQEGYIQVFCVGDLWHKAAGTLSSRIFTECNDAVEAGERAFQFVKSLRNEKLGILVKGSRVMEMEKAIAVLEG